MKVILVTVSLHSELDIHIFLSVFVLYKSDLIIISLKINLFSPWYSWKIAELALNGNHSLTPKNAHEYHNDFPFHIGGPLSWLYWLRLSCFTFLMYYICKFESHVLNTTLCETVCQWHAVVSSNPMYSIQHYVKQFVNDMQLWVRIPCTGYNIMWYSLPMTCSCEFESHVFDTTLCDTVCQWLAAGRWYGIWIYSNLCNQCQSPLKLWVWIPSMARCTRYNIMWYSLSMTCDRSTVW